MVAACQAVNEVVCYVQSLRKRKAEDMLNRILDGRTDLVFEFLSKGNPADSTDEQGVSLIKWCAYYGDVSAIRFLLSKGESLQSLGQNFDLNGAVFHGHWQLCQFLIENGADVNYQLSQSGETLLHAALCKPNRPAYSHIVKVLLANGANPNSVTNPSAETGDFMRDCLTKAETPLHRAAAFGTKESIQYLLDAGAAIDSKDMNGDSPLGWASWHLRPSYILNMLCYGDFSIHPDAVKRSAESTNIGWGGMEENLLGKPHV